MTNCQEHSEYESQELFKEAIDLCEDNHFDEPHSILEHLFQCHKNSIDIVQLNYYLGRCKSKRNAYNDALNFLKNAKNDASTRENKSLYLRVLREIGYCYSQLGDHKNALEILYEGEDFLSIWKENNFDEYIWYLYGIGYSQYFTKNFHEAIQTFAEIINSADQLQDEILSDQYESYSFLYLANSQLHTNDKDSALYNINQVNIKALDKSIKQSYFCTKIDILKSNERYEELIKTSNKFDKIGLNENSKAHIYHSTGQAYFELDILDKSKEYFEKALQFVDSDNSTHKHTKKYLEYWKIGERKYAILEFLHTLLVSVLFFLLLVNSTKPDYIISKYPEFIDKFRSYFLYLFLPILAYSAYINQKHFIRVKFLSRLNLTQKLLFYSPYIVILLLIICLKYFL